MIGKAEWFKRRKYGGWGLTPATKEGWVYVAFAIAIPTLLITLLPLNARTIALAVWMLILFADVLHIMTTLKKDEREVQHEAIAERNAFWGVLAVLIIGVLYDLINGAINESFQVNWWMIGALCVGVVTKSVSNYYLERNS